jgi:CheY-like chemotaxis protein
MADKRAVVAFADLNRLSLIVSTLRGAGAVVFPATTAEAARGISAHLHRVDILIVHTALPGAVELAEELRAAHPDLTCLYVAGITETGSEAGQFHASAGVLLREPFSPNVLLRAIAGIMEPAA